MVWLTDTLSSPRNERFRALCEEAPPEQIRWIEERTAEFLEDVASISEVTVGVVPEAFHQIVIGGDIGDGERVEFDTAAIGRWQAEPGDSRRRRRRLEHPGKPTTTAAAPNALWAADFKGEFLMRDGNYCYPLTVTDQHSRYVLACKALSSTREIPVMHAFERLFREYGLPDAIRTDNGVPFATISLGRLSRLSVWWIKLGIRPELTQPSHPEQNGQHERMHKTLKAETTRPPGKDSKAQQRKFDWWRREFNQERPHESLEMKPPAAIYVPSLRPFPKKIEHPTYPGHFQVRYVSRNHGIRWKRRWINVSATLREEYVGCEEVDDGVWNVWFGPLLLGRFDERELRIHGVRGLQS
jgi:hypothetical protein